MRHACQGRWANTSLGPPWSPSKEECEAQKNCLSLPVFPATSVSWGENEIPEIDTICETL